MHEALCSTLHLDKAISACVKAAPEDFPADGIFLNYYRDDIQSIQFLALATRNRGHLKLDVLSIPQHVLSNFIVSDNFTTVILNQLSDEPLTDFVIKTHFRKVKSAIVMRLKVDDTRLGAVVFFSYQTNAFKPVHGERVESLRGPFSLLSSRALLHLGLINEENKHTRYSHHTSQSTKILPAGFIAAQNSPISVLFCQLPSISQSQQPIMIKGEEGTGKSRLAHHLHQLFNHPDKPLTVFYAETMTLFINRPNRPPQISTLSLQSITSDTLLNNAGDGTFLIENIECLNENLQEQLIKNIQIRQQQGCLPRIIITRTLPNQTRVDPEHLLTCSSLDRLFCLCISLLPLRQRREDIPELVTHYLLKLGKKHQRRLPLLSTRFQQSLLTYGWPGNITELIARLEKALIASHSDILDIRPGEYAQETSPKEHTILSLNEIVKRHIIETLKHTNGKISGDGGAAQMLKVNSNTLYSKMKKLGITKETFS
ncbi:sigma 54-interacting transcriptional regulator [Budvicia diplopodorum]|uniref:sigma 54-interacting transcriptional regulator n=1 Tax=Budvicia diplopodorum TaxID=1119056 RepID=UPI00135AEB3A|nr:sigma 54-interacting transcriptional regulator [Budvicia diplopodorum]